MITIRKGIVASASAAAVAGLALLATSTVALGGEKHEAKVGKDAPNFTLTDIYGEEHTLSDYTDEGKVVVLEWFNPMCPFVVKHHEKMKTMTELAEKYQDDVVWLAINSANENHPTYAMNDKALEIVKKEWSLPYPVLVDASGKVGHMYGARTTPHMYIIDTEGVLRYAGAIDSDTGAKPYKKDSDVVNYVAQALDQILAGETVTMAETKAYGCSVKYAK